jgi:hypothetical protein
MNPFISHPDFYNQPIHLDRGEKNSPVEVMEDFFDSYCLYEVRQVLWDMVQTAVTTDNYLFSDFDRRDFLFLFYEKLEKLLEASFLLAGKQDVSVHHAHSA